MAVLEASILDFGGWAVIFLSLPWGKSSVPLTRYQSESVTYDSVNHLSLPSLPHQSSVYVYGRMSWGRIYSPLTKSWRSCLVPQLLAPLFRKWGIVQSCVLSLEALVANSRTTGQVLPNIPLHYNIQYLWITFFVQIVGSLLHISFHLIHMTIPYDRFYYSHLNNKTL